MTSSGRPSSSSTSNTAEPPDNGHHTASRTVTRKGSLWCPIVRRHGADAVRDHPDRTLLLSWPPCDTSDGVEILDAYSGDRVIYIGELDGGSCGDAALFATLDRDWSTLAEHVPVRWIGIRDVIRVHERRTAQAREPILTGSAT